MHQPEKSPRLNWVFTVFGTLWALVVLQGVFRANSEFREWRSSQGHVNRGACYSSMDGQPTAGPTSKPSSHLSRMDGATILTLFGTYTFI